MTELANPKLGESKLVNSKLANRWLAAYTKPRMEQVALKNLERQSFEAYLPLYKKFKKTETGMVPVLEPMFPRYIFFRPSKAEQSIESVRSTKGISNVVRFGHEPGMVSADIVEILKNFEADQNQATPETLCNLKAGQKVKLKHFTLGNMEGLLHDVSSKRVTVLVEILGGFRKVNVGHKQIEVKQS